jgi:hypothetical protein
MKSSTRQLVLAAVVAFAAAGLGGLALAQDKETVIKNRETLMKGQGKDLGSVKAYTEGKADLAQAETHLERRDQHPLDVAHLDLAVKKEGAAIPASPSFSP